MAIVNYHCLYTAGTQEILDLNAANVAVMLDCKIRDIAYIRAIQNHQSHILYLYESVILHGNKMSLEINDMVLYDYYGIPIIVSMPIERSKIMEEFRIYFDSMYKVDLEQLFRIEMKLL